MILRPGDAEEAGMDPTRVRLIAQRAEEWVNEGITPTLVVLVARRGVVVLHEAYGRLGPDSDAPALPRDALFPLVSISKPITATAAMILVEEGLLGLNRPVCEYLPEFAGEGKHAVMVHHLLTHTSGLRHEDVEAHAVGNGAPPLVSDSGDMPPVADYLRTRYDAPLWKPPGVEMSYCPFGYELLGDIVARVSGQPLAVFAQDKILEPLGMADTHFIVPEALRHRVVRRPAGAADAALLNGRTLQDEPYAMGGAFSTALDLAIFGQMFLNRGCYGQARVLSPAAVAEMTRDQIPGISARSGEEYFADAGWGYGWGIHGNKKAERDGSLHSPAAFDHVGTGGVHMWVDPTDDVVAVCLAVEQGPLCSDLFLNAAMAAVVDL
jgi:CubicO group peptidase (beta-lactamase class C family)